MSRLLLLSCALLFSSPALGVEEDASLAPVPEAMERRGMYRLGNGIAFTGLGVAAAGASLIDSGS